MSIIVVLINILACYYLFQRARNRNSPFQIFYLTLLALVIAPGLLDAIMHPRFLHPAAGYVYVFDATILRTHAIILLYLLTFIALDLLIPSPTLELHPTGSSIIRLGVYGLIFVGLLLVILVLIRTLGITAIKRLSFTDLRSGGFLTYTSLLMTYTQLLIVGLPAILLVVMKKRIEAFAVLATFFAIAFFLGGSRQVVAISLAVMAVMMLRNVKPSYVAVTAVLSVTYVDFIMRVFKLIRNTTGFENRINVIMSAWSGAVDLSGTSSETGIRFFNYMIMRQPLPDIFHNFDYLIRSLLFWLPSQLDVLGIKPEDFEYKLFAYLMGGRHGTMHATFFGSSFADAGWLFPVWVVWIKMFMLAFDKAIVKGDEVGRWFLWSTGVYASIMFARGSLYAPVVVGFVAIIILMIQNFIRPESARKTRTIA